jgi:sugar phosphate isomerase/epimerase
MTWTLSAFADEAGETLNEQIAALNEAQIDHVDLRNVDGYNIVDLPLDHAATVKKKLDDVGVALCMYGSPVGKIDIADDFQVEVRRMRHLGELKQIFGTQAVRMFSYYNKAGAPQPRWRAEAIDRVKRLVELAEKNDLILYHEHEPGLYGGSFAAVMDLYNEMAKLGTTRFRLIFDFDNYNQAGEDVWANYQSQRQYISAIHIKESQKQPDGSFMHVPAGRGDGKVARVLADLAACGWEGSLTLEPHLARTAAVLKTAPHGQANRDLADRTPHECFVIAAKAARQLLHEVGRLDTQP